METLLNQLTWWHWLALALILFGIEMMTGTFDLLMILIAAVVTAIFAGFAPEAAAGWQGQLVVFGLSSAALVTGGRMFFAGGRRQADEHPTLNRRMAGLIGQRGAATKDFFAGNGQVKIGDTVWAAEAAAGEAEILAGDTIVVETTRSNLAVVRKG
jgi:membrane protein implicated in regulation of membrane protease activity